MENKARRAEAVIPELNAHCPARAPRQPEGMPAIVTARKPRGRKAAWVDDGRETPPEIKALIERMMLGRGPGSST
jgi:hypothetical protein